MDICMQNDGATPIARTQRYERDRGFTRNAHVIVPPWEPIPTWATDDDALARRYEQEADEAAHTCDCGGVGYGQHVAMCAYILAHASA